MTIKTPQVVEEENIIERIDISDYLRTFLHELSNKENKRIEVKSELDALRIKELMNIPENTTFKSLDDIRGQQPYWKYQKVDCVPSNLGRGRGYLFYFICNSCERKVKFLYFHTYTEPPMCRKCYRLPYSKSPYNQRKLSRWRLS